MALSLELKELAGKLVSFRTVSVPGRQGELVTDSTRPIADYVSNRLEDGGFIVEQFSYFTEGVEKVSIVAIKGCDHPYLAFSGHMDVVPVGEWSITNDPFKLEQVNDSFYARGIADMKLFDAIAVLAGSQIFASSLKRPFGIYFTPDEEVGCLGIKQLLKVVEPRGGHSEFKIKSTEHESVPIPDYVVIGEPTEMVPIYMHKGYVFLRISIRATGKGEERHSSDPYSAKSVLKTGLPEVLSSLYDLEKQLEFSFSKGFDIPYPTINSGYINMGKGSAKNVLTPECSIDLEIRTTSEYGSDILVEVVRDVVERSVSNLEGIDVYTTYKRSPTPPMQTPVDSEVVQVAASLSGNNPATVPFNTEGGIFNEHGSQCVIIGPASIKQAHKKNEFAESKWFDQDIIDFYVKFIKQMCF